MQKQTQKQMTDTTYNGWANWATWNVLLWATNEQPIYDITTRFVKRQAWRPGFTAKCKDFFLNMFPQGTPDMDDVLEMCPVNWDEIAQHLKEWND